AVVLLGWVGICFFFQAAGGIRGKLVTGVQACALPISRRGAAPRRVAFNVDPRESDPARLTMDEFQAAVTRLKPTAGSEERIEARQQEDSQHMWQYAVALMLIALAVEGFLAARTA